MDRVDRVQLKNEFKVMLQKSVVGVPLFSQIPFYLWYKDIQVCAVN